MATRAPSGVLSARRRRAYGAWSCRVARRDYWTRVRCLKRTEKDATLCAWILQAESVELFPPFSPVEGFRGSFFFCVMKLRQDGSPTGASSRT
eukprot:IDg21929t1